MAIGAFSIVDTTLREGEQFAYARFTTKDKQDIARALDALGVEYIELSSPASSPISVQDTKLLLDLGLRAKIVPHLRCDRKDISLALDCGVRVIHMMFGTSAQLQMFSHGKTIDFIAARAAEMTRFCKDEGCEVRFSGEDAFRSRMEDLDRVFDTVVEAGVDRIGLPDTVGRATPFEVHEVVSRFRKRYPGIQIEFHCHNDTGCAIANAWAALEAGATHINTTVLGIGERNGITPLGGLIARLYAIDRSLVTKYNLKQLKPLDELVASKVGISIPFNNPLTSPTAFYHRAGIHTNAILRAPESYEIFNLDDFGLTRTLDRAHRLIGKNVIKSRAAELGLTLSEDLLYEITWEIKTMSDQERLTPEFVDNLLRDAAAGRFRSSMRFTHEGSTIPNSLHKEK
ncbi:MAG: homocitrate synthase [Candidatus Sumerlaeia bacterium]|nr:homocitrate synthase [Candidatus Sumerlaeia bacterium]